MELEDLIRMLKKLGRLFPVFHIIGFLLITSWTSTAFNPYVEDKTFDWTLGEVLIKVSTLLVGYYFAHILTFINCGSFKGYPEYRALFGPSPAPSQRRGLMAGVLLAILVWVAAILLYVYGRSLVRGDLDIDIILTNVIATSLVVLLGLFLDWRFNQFEASRQLMRI
ncbi:MAG: hypothetical protein KatS3mg070_2899 [Meiothermus sp.]|uniref:hypothetical protein n=1 Tax=Meiothermus sp. TaxID=1955249 RepID=UPI0021DBBE5B|nr:hypothetical protein [Meiothermus sp.]GIW29536.1 MAG: hypothetical protein KatS3mg070_2899 [Meiothermus sp.]